MSNRAVEPSQQETIWQEDQTNMSKAGENMNEQGMTASSQVDFIRLAGIGPELAEFVTEFIERPEIFFSMPFEKRCEIENRMDAILSAFARLYAIQPKTFNRSDRNPRRKGF